MSTDVHLVETKSLEERALTWPEQARAVAVISDQSTYSKVGEMLSAIKGLRSEIDETFNEPIKKAFEAHRAMIDSKRRVEAPLVEAERVLKGAVGTFEADQRLLRREEEERQRKLMEQQEQQLQFDNALAAENLGSSPEVVNAVLGTPVPVAPVVVGRMFERPAGVSTAEMYKAEVTDLLALCRAVADGRVSREFILPNMTALNGTARALKSTMSVPGVKVVVETVTRVRGR